MGVKMEKIIGHRGSGKTTKLLEFADKNGCIVVEPTYRHAVNASQMAIKNGLRCDVIPIDTFLRIFGSRACRSAQDLYLTSWTNAFCRWALLDIPIRRGRFQFLR